MYSTNRLHIRQLKVSDREFMYDLLNSDGFKQNIADRGINTLAKAELEITGRYSINYPDLGFFAVELTEVGAPNSLATGPKSDTELETSLNFHNETQCMPKVIGGVTLIQREYLDVPDLGFAFLPEFTGQGYAYEASVGLLEWARCIGHKKLCAIAQSSNQASIALLKKLGFKYIGEKTFAPKDGPQAYFEITLKNE